MRLEINKQDLDELIQHIVEEVSFRILTDLNAEIEDNIITMNTVGYTNQLLTDIYLDLADGTVYVNAPYAGYVEFGTPGQNRVPTDPWSGTHLEGPGMTPGRRGPPPLDAIVPWARVKGAVKVGRRVTYPTKKQATEVAENIRWHIFWNGTKPHPFMRNAIDTIEKRYENTTINLEISI